jgi:hypothetical protein
VGTVESLKPMVDAFMTGDKKSAAAALSEAVAALKGYEAEYGAYYLKVVSKVTDKGDAFVKTVREDSSLLLLERGCASAPPAHTPACARRTLSHARGSNELHVVERKRASNDAWRLERRYVRCGLKTSAAPLMMQLYSTTVWKIT